MASKKTKDLTTNANGGSGKVYEPQTYAYAKDVTPSVDKRAAATRDAAKSTTPTASPGEVLNTPAQQQAAMNVVSGVKQPTQTDGSGIPASAVQLGLNVGGAAMKALGATGTLGKAAQTAAQATLPKSAGSQQTQQPVAPQGSPAPAGTPMSPNGAVSTGQTLGQRLAQRQQPVQTPQQPTQQPVGAYPAQTGAGVAYGSNVAQGAAMQPYDPSSIQSFLESYFGQAQQQTQAKIDNATAQGIRQLQQTQEKSNQQIQEQRNQAAIQGAKAQDNQALYAEARGDRGGIGAAQYDAVMNNTARIQASLNQQQTQVANDTAQQIAQLRANGEYEKADALLELGQQYLSQLISLQQWALSYNMDVAQFNRQLEQDARNYAMRVADLTGYYNGTPTLAYQKYMNDLARQDREWEYQLASDEWNRQYKLQQDQDKNTEQLAKLGLSILEDYGTMDAVPENVRAAMQSYLGDTGMMVAQIQAAQRAAAAQAASRSSGGGSGGSRRSGGGGGSSGGGSSAGTSGNLSDYERGSDAWFNQLRKLADAAGVSGGQYIENRKKEWGLTDAQMKSLTSGYNSWAEKNPVNNYASVADLNRSTNGSGTKPTYKYKTYEQAVAAVKAAGGNSSAGSRILTEGEFQRRKAAGDLNSGAGFYTNYGEYLEDAVASMIDEVRDEIRYRIANLNGQLQDANAKGNQALVRNLSAQIRQLQKQLGKG